MDIKSTDGLKAAANVWRGGRGLVVEVGGRRYDVADVSADYSGNITMRLGNASRHDTAALLVEMNRDPVSGLADVPEPRISDEELVGEAIAGHITSIEPQPELETEPATSAKQKPEPSAEPSAPVVD